jgi:hypothetical protein
MKCSIGPSCLHEPWGLASANPIGHQFVVGRADLKRGVPVMPFRDTLKRMAGSHQQRFIEMPAYELK